MAAPGRLPTHPAGLYILTPAACGW